jgi:hypothetical protein
MHSYRTNDSHWWNLRAGAELESEQREAWINLTKVIKDLNQSSKESKASFAQEDKPRSIIPIFFKLMQLLLIYGIVH